MYSGQQLLRQAGREGAVPGGVADDDRRPVSTQCGSTYPDEAVVVDHFRRRPS
jgi:hypothetical protein